MGGKNHRLKANSFAAIVDPLMILLLSYLLTLSAAELYNHATLHK